MVRLGVHAGSQTLKTENIKVNFLSLFVLCTSE